MREQPLRCHIEGSFFSNESKRCLISAAASFPAALGRIQFHLMISQMSEEFAIRPERLRVPHPLLPASRISIVFRITTSFMGPGRPPDHPVLDPFLAKDKQDARTAGSPTTSSNSPHHQPHRCNPA